MRIRRGANDASTRVPAGAAFAHRDFRLFWVGALISNTGGWMQRVTVPFVLFEATGSATVVGVAAFLQFLPVVLLGPVGGSLADRHARRSLLLLTQSVSAVLAMTLAALWWTGRASPAAIIAVVTLVGATFGVNGPTWQAFVSELVPRELLLNAVTLNSTQFNAARALGPALAGVVLATLGAGWAFLLNALSFVAVLVALLAIRSGRVRPQRVGRARPVREIRAAARYARGHRGILASYAVVGALGFFGGPLVQLLVVFAEEVFEVGDQAYGLLGASLGIGAVLGAPLIAGRGSGWPRQRLVRAAVAAYGSALIVFATAPVYAVGLAALLVAGAGWLALASTLNTTIQVQVDDELRGKVLALYLMVLTSAMPVGALLQGAMVDVVGPRATVAGAGVLFLAVGAWVAQRTDLLDHMDTPLDEPVATRLRGD